MSANHQHQHLLPQPEQQAQEGHQQQQGGGHGGHHAGDDEGVEHDQARLTDDWH